MHKHLCAAAALVGLASASLASASLIDLGPDPIVVSGSIFRVTPQFGGPDFEGASAVDHWYVTVTTTGHYSFNVLSWEFDNGSNSVVDVNGDGEIAFIDSYLRLFRDDGDLTSDDQVARNDDKFSHDGANSDGSIYGYDSYLSVLLDPGTYILAIGAYHMSIDDAILGLDVDNNYYPVSYDEDLDDFVPSDHGDYEITMGLVPAPGGAALFGLASLALIRRRR